MPNNSKTNVGPRSFYSYLVLGAVLFAFIQTVSLLSPILFSHVKIQINYYRLKPIGNYRMKRFLVL
jgi:hypothetical protein